VIESSEKPAVVVGTSSSDESQFIRTTNEKGFTMKVQQLFYSLFAMVILASLFGTDEASLADAARGGLVCPLKDAAAVWDFSRTDDPSLKVHGGVKTGVLLEGPDRAASLERGGDGYVAQFRGGYLTTISEKPIQLAGKNASICLRLHDTSRQWNSGLLATANPEDRLANLIYANGANLFYRWRTTPPWERVEGIRKPSEEEMRRANIGSYGFNGESNDAHDLLEYAAGEWKCSVVCVHDNGKVIVSDQNSRAEKQIDIGRQMISNDAFYVGSKAGKSEFFDGDIAEILVYNRPLTEDETRHVNRHLRSKLNPAPSTKSARLNIPTNGLVLRLDSKHAQVNDDGRVSLWKDTSGNRNDVKQTHSSRMPRRVDNTLGDLPAVNFGDEQFLQGRAVLAEGDDSFTIVSLWRRDHLNGSEVICEQNSPEKLTGRRAALLAQGRNVLTGNQRMRNMNFSDGILPVSALVDWFGRDGWYDVVIRFADTVIELYVDGILIDEEWPHGALYLFCSPFIFGAGYRPDGKVEAGFSGEIDHIAFWDRALSAEEIVALSGGRDRVARRDIEILGEPQKSIQYWKPRGKAYAGDCMVEFHDGVFHVYYLYDRLHHAAKWGLGGHQYGHWSSSNLVHWTHHPLMIRIDRQWECAMGTGNVIFNTKDGKWYTFYTDCGSRIQFFDKPQRGARLFCAVSEDGIHFKKDFKPVLPGFDCDIFYIPETGKFHLIAEGGRSHSQSDDLVHWTPVPNSEFSKTALKDKLSEVCPNTFGWNGWYYFKTGSGPFYKSRQPVGPWEKMPHYNSGLAYPKMHEFKNGRALAAGWLPFPGWGGNLVLREMVQHPNGDLGMKFVPELIPASGQPIALTIAKRKGAVRGSPQMLRVGGRKGLNYAAIDNVPYNVRILMTVQPGSGVNAFGLCFRGEGDYVSGNELRFEPKTGRVQFAHPHEGGLAQPAHESLIMDNDIGSLGPLAAVKDLDKPFTLDIILKDRILDVCIDDRRAFSARRPEDSGLGGKRLFLFSRDGEVTFKDIRVLPLLK
jgi:beta-fructofuranosidase